MPSLDELRQQKDDWFGHSPDSPLPDEDRPGFAGLRYYPENAALRLSVTLEEFPEKETVTMQTSTGELRDYERWGKFAFTVDGRPAGLTVYGPPEQGLFVPFKDATSGKETYGAGRYLELVPLAGGQYLADFNLAYNPWCAYSPYYSCPIPPAENRLRVPILAGELDYHLV